MVPRMMKQWNISRCRKVRFMRVSYLKFIKGPNGHVKSLIRKSHKILILANSILAVFCIHLVFLADVYLYINTREFDLCLYWFLIYQFNFKTTAFAVKHNKTDGIVVPPYPQRIHSKTPVDA